MTHIATKPKLEPTNGCIDLDFRDPGAWPDYYGGKGLTILFGDEDAGPFVFLSAFKPMDEMMPTGFAHGHASDNWRISVRGTTNMGRDEYTEGQFRYHDGGAPYASDNLTWGPDGGFGLVLMADRRGFAINPVKKKLAQTMDPEQRAVAGKLGIEIHNPCPGAPAITTTLGNTKQSHLDGGFDSAQTWPEVAPGVRVCLGLAGDRECGPVIVLIDADPGTEAFPQHTLTTELMLVPQDGEMNVGGLILKQGAIRIEEANQSFPPIVAAENGAKLTMIVGNRQSLMAALQDGTISNPDYAAGLGAILEALQSDLARA